MPSVSTYGFEINVQVSGVDETVAEAFLSALAAAATNFVRYGTYFAAENWPEPLVTAEQEVNNFAVVMKSVLTSMGPEADALSVTARLTDQNVRVFRQA